MEGLGVGGVQKDKAKLGGSGRGVEKTVKRKLDWERVRDNDRNRD